MYTKLNASRAYVYAVARACDAGKISRSVGAPVPHWSRNETRAVGRRAKYGVWDRNSLIWIRHWIRTVMLTHHNRTVRVPFCILPRGPSRWLWKHSSV